MQEDLWRGKREREALEGALRLSQAALALTRDDLFRVVARGRLRVDEVWSTGIAAAVIKLDGGVDVVELERRISARMQVSPTVGGQS